MRLLLLAITLILLVPAHAQQDTTAQQKKGVFSTVREKYNDLRSLPFNKSDSLKNSLNTPDSLVATPADSLKKIQGVASKPVDSLQNISDQVNGKMNAPMHKVNNGIDSVEQKLNQPLGQVNNKITEGTSTVQEKITGSENQINENINKVEGKIDAGFSKATDGTVQRPGGDVNVKADGLVSEQMPGIEGANLPGVDGANGIPGADKVKVPEADLSLKELQEKANINVPGAEKVSNITGEMDNVDAKLAKGEALEGELKSVANGDLSNTENISKTAEENLQNIEQVQAATAELQKATAEQERYAALVKRYQDKEALQKEIQRKALNIATDKINQFSPEFKQAQAELAKMKKLNPAVEGYKDLKKKRVNEMKGKPFREHLIPGLTVQAFQLDKVFTVDWGLQCGYKFSKRFVVGAGGTYRTSFSEQFKPWAKLDQVYGFRNYVNFGMYKTFYAHAEYAALYGKIDVKLPETERQKVQCGYFGVGKRYDISKKWRGSILVLYRAQFDGKIPMMSKVNMRIEFNYNTKKRKQAGWEKKLKENKAKAKESSKANE